MLTTAIDILSGHSIGALAATAAAVMLAGFLRGFVGFGGAIAIVLVMSAAYDPMIAIPVASLVGVPSTFQLLPSIIRDSDRKFVVGFSLAAVATAPLGGFVLVALDPASMKIILSVFVLVMVVPLYMEWRPPAGALAGLPGVLLTGVISGAIQGSASMGGPPAVVAALARPGQPSEQRANVMGAIATLNFCAVPPFYLLGLYTPTVVVLCAVVVPLYMLATLIGARYFTRIGHTYFRTIALLVLALLGVGTLVLAVIEGATA